MIIIGEAGLIIIVNSKRNCAFTIIQLNINDDQI